MKILHLLHQYLPEKIGGTELYTRTLARMQAASGHEVAIFTPTVAETNWPEAAVEDGIRVYRLSLGERSSTAVFQHTFYQPDIKKNFQQILKKIQPEIIHIQHLMGLPASLVNIIQAQNIPYVVTLHDYWYICANAQLITNYDETICAGPNWYLNCAHCALARAEKAGLAFLQPAVAPLMAYRNLRLKKALNEAGQLIAPTNFVRQIYRDLGIDPQKIKVIPHGIQPPETLHHAKRQEDDPLRVVYIGGLSPQKGVHVLVEAVNSLDPNRVRLRIFGDMTAFPNYTAALQQQSEHNNIHFGGRLPHEDLWNVLAESDIVVVPSLWYETASLIIQEAFAAGVPVLASEIGALRERVRDEVDGRLFPPGRAADLSALLEEFCRQPEKLAQLAAQIQPVFTIDQHQQAIENVYRLVLAQPSAV